MKLHKAHKCDRELTQLVCEKTIESGSLNAQMVEWSKAALLFREFESHSGLLFFVIIIKSTYSNFISASNF